jgi:hypothetical protein
MRANSFEYSWLGDETLEFRFARTAEIAARYELDEAIKAFLRYMDDCNNWDCWEEDCVFLTQLPRDTLDTVRSTYQVQLSKMAAEDRAALGYLNKCLKEFLCSGMALQLPEETVKAIAVQSLRAVARNGLPKRHAKRSRPKAAA